MMDDMLTKTPPVIPSRLPMLRRALLSSVSYPALQCFIFERNIKARLRMQISAIWAGVWE